MTPAQRDIPAIFAAALEHDALEERTRFLDQACGGDSLLRERVELLLRAHADAGKFLGGEPSLTTAPVAAERPGVHIGSYKLLEQIGEGGFGVVFLAEQMEPVRRQVALKVIKPGMDTRQVIARFEAERQALAVMDHSNIARVFDAGATESGRPFFVMELVQGKPITQFCDEHNLSIRDRLDLFAAVCRAIQHAHTKGIIHRDIKPTNILVSNREGAPVVKVIDFGIAKAMGQQLTDMTLFTGLQQMVGTPLYMSPEQAELSGSDIDTRSDIYSLGVLLYELLTGTTPVSKDQLKEAAFDEIRRIIREDEPPKPSTRISSTETALSIASQRQTEPAKLTRLVRGELDWIVMKALEKDRTRRYQTASDVALDVQRYLADEPVQACPPSALYRYGKFARQNKRALTSVAVLLIAFVAVAGTLGWAVRDRKAHQQEAERTRLLREAAVAAEVNLALQEAEQWQRQAKWPEALSSAKRAQALLASSSSDELRQRVLQFRKDQDIILRLEESRSDLGSVISHENQNRAFVQVFADLGIDVEQLSPPEVAARIRSRPSTAVRMAAALDDWAQILRDWGKWDPAKRDPALWKQRLEAARLADPDLWRSQLRQLTAEEDLPALRALADSSDFATVPVQSLRLMGAALAFGGDRQACIAWLRQAHRQHPDDAWISFALAYHLSQSPTVDWREVLRFAEAGLAAQPTPSMYNYVGSVLNKMGQHVEALTCIRRALELKPNFDSAHRNLGDALVHQGKLEEAIASYRRAIELSPGWSWPYANLGSALATQGKLDEAIACCRKSVELSPEWNWVHVNLGHLLSKQGKLDEAIAAYREGLRLKPDDQPTQRRLGDVLVDQNLLDDAISAFREAIRLKPSDFLPHRSLGVILAKKGQQDEAVKAFREAIRLNPNDKTSLANLEGVLRQIQLNKAVEDAREAVCLKPDDHQAHFKLGNALRDLKKYDEAVNAYRRAIQLDPNDGQFHFGLGVSLYRKGLSDDASQALRTSLALGVEQSSVYEYLGLARENTNDFSGAAAAYRRAIELNPKSVWAHSHLGDALRNSGKFDEAIAVYRALIELNPQSAPAFKSLGRALRDNGDLDGAIATFEETLRLQPTYDAARFELAAALAQSKQRDRAARVYAETLSRHSEVWPGPWYEAIDSEEVFTRLTALLREDPRLRIMRARLRCLQGDWTSAAADYARANRLLAGLDQAQLHRHSDALIGYACVLLVLGDRSGYEQFCQQWADRVGEARGWDYSLSRTWAIGPRAAVSARQIAERASKEVERQRMPWNLQVLSLAHYRCGEFELAIECASESNAGGWNGSAKALNWFVLAMAQHRLGRTGDARTSLQRARTLIGQVCPVQPPGVKWFHLAPTDALEVELLRREAEALIEGKCKDNLD